MSTITFGVLGPVTAWDGAGAPVALRGPMHRAVLARLIVARGRVVPVGDLVDDLWTAPPPGAVNAVRTFVAALRRALEPGRAPRAKPELLVTEGPGYALRAGPDAVDAWRFERAVAAGRDLEEALGWWRGPAYAEFAEAPWARGERSRLGEVRLRAVERLAAARLVAGRAAEAVPDLEAHTTENPWREEGWRLLALALYRSGRQGDALAVLRRARTLLVGHLGVEPGPALRRLETGILRQSEDLDTADEVWAEVAAAYDRIVAAGARARLEATVGLLRNLAVTGGGGLEAARQHRTAAIATAEELGDAELTARVIGSYDVPAIWTRVDDPAQSARIRAAAERTLAALPAGRDGARARLLATIAVESRGTGDPRVLAHAREAERIARRLDEPALLAFALNGVFLQTFHRTGLAGERDAIGAELIALATRHGLITAEVLGHLIRLQSHSALGDFPAADHHAAAADTLAARHELALVGVFTRWYRALRRAAAAGEQDPAAESAYRDAAESLVGAGMPGLEPGLLPLARLGLRIQHHRPAPTENLDWGPYEPWAEPLVLLAQDRPHEAAIALHATPEPPHDLLSEAMWCLTARAAVTLGDQTTMVRAQSALLPAAAELAGAASGLLTLGPVAGFLLEIEDALRTAG